LHEATSISYCGFYLDTQVAISYTYPIKKEIHTDLKFLFLILNEIYEEVIMETYRFQVVIEQDEDGLYVADVPALQGCHTQGKTFEEALKNIREVILMCVQEMREDGQTIETQYPEIVAIKTLEIAV